MKRSLILMRHSKAEPFGIASDKERELTPAGRKKAMNFAKKLQKKDIIPDLVIHTDAKRSFQTAQIVVHQLNLPESVMQKKSELYLGEVDWYLDVIQNLDESINTALIVGHESAISQATLQIIDTKNLSDISIARTLHLGLSTANAALLRIKTAWRKVTLQSVKKCKILRVE